jgi:uncharacterized protein
MFNIDSHIHINMDGIYFNNFIKYLDKEKIDFCWMLNWEEINPGLWPYRNLTIEDVYQTFCKYPTRIIPFYAPDPHRKDACTQIEYWYNKGIRGCGELKATLNWNSDEINILLQTVSKLRLPVVFHMEESRHEQIPFSSSIYDKTLFYITNSKRKILSIPKIIVELLVQNYVPLKISTNFYIFPGYMLDFVSLELMLQKFPDISFIAHGPMFWKNISDNVAGNTEMYPKGLIKQKGIIWRLLENYPNLYADISAFSGFNALKRDPTNAQIFLTTFEDKILYGTDNTMIGQKEYLKSLRLSLSTYQKIFGDNSYHIVGAALEH